MSLDRILLLGVCAASFFSGLSVILMCGYIAALRQRVRGLESRLNVELIRAMRPTQ